MEGKKEVPRKKKTQFKPAKKFNNKIQIEDLPQKTMEVTIYALRWIFLLIFVFITIGIFVLFITGGLNYVQTIIGYSITGFFTFFMGYFGWILAQGIIDMLSGKSDKDNQSVSYYVRKRPKSR